MNEIHLPKTKVAELHAICAERNNDPGELINILHAAKACSDIYHRKSNRLSPPN